jgi:drug/metabolite transporter (DMT)-like permease
MVRLLYNLDAAMVHPAFGLGIGVFAIATGSILIRYALDQGVEPLVVAAWRLGVAALVLLPFALRWAGQELRTLGRRDFGLITLSAALLALHFAAWIQSLNLTSQASSVVLVSTIPVWVALAAPWTIGERISWSTGFGVLLAMGGATMITLASIGADTGRPDPLLGNVLALVGAWGYAGYLIVGRRLRQRLSLLAYVTPTYGIAAVFFLVALFVFGDDPLPPTSAGLGWCVLLALLPQLVGHSTLNWALARLPAATVSVIALGEPVGAIVLAVPLLHVVPGSVELLGAAIVLVGIWWAGRGAMLTPPASSEGNP